VFVNGRRVRGATGSAGAAGVEIASIADLVARRDERLADGFARLAKFDRNGFTALSTAFLHDGAFIAIAENAVVEPPIEIVFATSAAKGGVVAHPRIFIRAGRASRATIVERYVSIDEGDTLTNAVAEVLIAEAAQLTHLRIASEGARASHVATTQVAQGRDSRYSSFAIALDAAFLRHNLAVRCDAPGAECALDGLYLAGGRTFIDNHTEIDHAAPHTASRELYKGILGGHAKAVFNGTIIVRPDAQKTDAQQTNRNLLLSRHAEIDTKPELQISADDVKCSHGAAIGQLDPQALFYLKSRGIGEAAGRRLLVHAFANEMIERFGDARLAPALERVVTASIHALLGGER
jgi:Fe-S cluster assembly protein SufD